MNEWQPNRQNIRSIGYCQQGIDATRFSTDQTPSAVYWQVNTLSGSTAFNRGCSSLLSVALAAILLHVFHTLHVKFEGLLVERRILRQQGLHCRHCDQLSGL